MQIHETRPKSNELSLLERVKKLRPLVEGRQTFRSGNRDYYSFTAQDQIKYGLIDQEVFEDLERGERLLSVGCGFAELERSMMSLGIDKKAITLADQKKQHFEMEEGIEFYEFDMFRRWPMELESRFKYVLFPQCLEIGLYAVALEMGHVLDPQINYRRQRREVQEAVAEFRKMQREDPQVHEKYEELERIGLYRAVEEVFPKEILEKEFNALDQALFALKEGGEIRIGGDQMPSIRRAYHQRKLSGRCQIKGIYPELSIITKTTRE